VKELEDKIRRLRMENEFLKKPRQVQPVNATVTANVSAGVRYSSVLRGLVLSFSATASSWVRV
jgi:hypothetical protein